MHLVVFALELLETLPHTTHHLYWSITCVQTARARRPLTEQD